jgi:hypothetical protein
MMRMGISVGMGVPSLLDRALTQVGQIANVMKPTKGLLCRGDSLNILLNGQFHSK